MPETKGKSLEMIDRTFSERKSAVSLKGLRLRRTARGGEDVELDVLRHSSVSAHGQRL